MSLHTLREVFHKDVVPTLKELIEKQFQDWSCKIVSLDKYHHIRKQREHKSILKQISAVFFYISQHSKNIISEISPYIIKCFNGLVENYVTDGARNTIEDRGLSYSLLVHIVHVMIIYSIRVQNLEIFPLNLAKGLILQHFHYLDNLTELSLPGRCVDFQSYEVAERIKYLTMLKKFEYKFDCTNSVVREIGRYCPCMQIINLRFSRKVSDMCIDDLLRLRSLSELDLQYTSVTSMGYIELLLELKIEKIVWVRNVDKVLSRIRQGHLFHVRAITCYTENPVLLVSSCPQITELTLHGITVDLRHLVHLLSLRVLNVQICNYKKICLKNLLPWLGKRLEELRFRDVDYLFIDDVIVYCKILTTLEIHSCNIDKGGYPPYTDPSHFYNHKKLKRPHGDRFVDSPHFFNLKNLKLTNSNNLEAYFTKLRFYSNLQVLHARGIPDFTDVILHDAVTFGRLNNLRELIIELCPFGYSSAVSSIINQCANLAKFGNLQMIDCFKGTDGNVLKDYMAKYNGIMFIDQSLHYVHANMIRYRPKRKSNEQFGLSN